ncbi:hypothetical protein J3A72_001445 [Stenotrophomonas sp. PvP093]|jgi:hypothetical protein|uniref:hypothetical protein n=1 Tax=Stenotrophomonas TaxID=40323 RepID=UPI0007B22BF3|nr:MULTISPECIES: hypothetical protein [Stenotrophomonas]KZE53898.1 hypothetical protein AVW14_08980 [Stenotrophomonas maltophilia]MBP2481153.1 hypothetical protein [Stenotrophomonas sp. PvP093]
MHPTIHLQGVPIIAGQQTQLLHAPAENAAITLVTPTEQAMTLATPESQRLSAVVMPDYTKPKISDLQRGRLELLETFEHSENLVVAECARMVGKSRKWVTYEIQAGNLLALQFGNKGQRVPEWQMDPLNRRLVQKVIRRTPRADIDLPHPSGSGRRPGPRPCGRPGA